ncbi:hypothetical protein H2248_006999 [Termitomyces sp. 'cryptogamus']|nr:hypothetical protein H2248_006999 [Termitomyces sp. 'cryptogamus']
MSAEDTCAFVASLYDNEPLCLRDSQHEYARFELLVFGTSTPGMATFMPHLCPAELQASLLPRELQPRRLTCSPVFRTFVFFYPSAENLYADSIDGQMNCFTRHAYAVEKHFDSWLLFLPPR